MNDLKIQKAILVYQGGLANVFAVTGFDNNNSRDAVRLCQGTFNQCLWYATALGRAGTIVRTMGCNVAGDCSDCVWTKDPSSLPFSDKLVNFHSP